MTCENLQVELVLFVPGGSSQLENVLASAWQSSDTGPEAAGVASCWQCGRGLSLDCTCRTVVCD